MKAFVFTFSLLFSSTLPFVAEELDYPKAKVNFSDFTELVDAVESHRASRLVSLDEFLELSKQDDVVILDARSKYRYDRIHLKGAKHLNFSDFTQERLMEVIPSFSTTVLIYCNNNFEGNQVDFSSKVALPVLRTLEPVDLEEVNVAELVLAASDDDTTAARQFAMQEKPRMMALNIPTYINLYGYGYRNVYELDELVDVDDPRLRFEGSIVEE